MLVIYITTARQKKVDIPCLRRLQPMQHQLLNVLGSELKNPFPRPLNDPHMGYRFLYDDFLDFNSNSWSDDDTKAFS
jgi:hypothetical protein